MPTESPRSTLMFSAQTHSYKLKLENESAPVTSASVERTPGKKLPSPKLYRVLPKYNTPVRRPLRNPFNERLIDTFNAPTCSPDFNINTQSPQVEHTNDFFWTAEDLWRIDPAPIDSPQTDVEDNIDEETESLAQEAIERYFQESHNILSPIGSPKSVVLYNRGVTPEVATPVAERAMSTPCTRFDSRRIVKTTVSTQTLLSFCSDLPQHLLNQLKPFMNSLEEVNLNNDSSSMSTSTLRRKLEFDEVPSSGDEEGVVLHRFCPSDWTPDKVKAELFSKSPDISPIAEGIKTDCFNFTREMAIDITTSPISRDKNRSSRGDMSIDFGESLVDSSVVRQSSGDTGYQTNSLDKARVTDPATRSYVCNASTAHTGVTSTPSRKQHVKY